mmetsp:Transcript_109841/g.307109  ORF Transcript_109841/g.307109 Transcript_109841/m.307109 type:complete len:299 (-) Transcript_109841:24-920(-)
MRRRWRLPPSPPARSSWPGARRMPSARSATGSRCGSRRCRGRTRCASRGRAPCAPSSRRLAPRRPSTPTATTSSRRFCARSPPSRKRATASLAGRMPPRCSACSTASCKTGGRSRPPSTPSATWRSARASCRRRPPARRARTGVPALPRPRRRGARGPWPPGGRARIPSRAWPRRRSFAAGRPPLRAGVPVMSRSRLRLRILAASAPARCGTRSRRGSGTARALTWLRATARVCTARIPAWRGRHGLPAPRVGRTCSGTCRRAPWQLRAARIRRRTANRVPRCAGRVRRSTMATPAAL